LAGLEPADTQVTTTVARSEVKREPLGHCRQRGGPRRHVPLAHLLVLPLVLHLVLHLVFNLVLNLVLLVNLRLLDYRFLDVRLLDLRRLLGFRLARVAGEWALANGFEDVKESEKLGCVPGLHATLDEHALELALAHSEEVGNSPSLLLKRGPVGLGAAGTHQLGDGRLGQRGLGQRGLGEGGLGEGRLGEGGLGEGGLGEGGLGEGGLVRKSAGVRRQRCRRWRTLVRGARTGEGEGILEGLPLTKTALDRSDGAALHCLGQCSPARGATATAAGGARARCDRHSCRWLLGFTRWR